ncbi:MAG: Smr/MutS family protein [Rhodospirillales bacterium]
MADRRRKPAAPQPPALETAPPAEDDDALWARVTRDVTPLPHREDRIDHPATTTPPTASAPGKAATPRNYAAAPLPLPAAPAPVRALSHGDAPGLDRRTQTRMRRGKMAVEGRLDLHGMFQAEAHRALIGFITRAYGQGKRCVLVITGKGTKETGEIGVLRRAVPGWLNQPPLKDLIHAFDHAARHHGGAGALYILLKRNKGPQ